MQQSTKELFSKVSSVRPSLHSLHFLLWTCGSLLVLRVINLKADNKKRRHLSASSLRGLGLHYINVKVALLCGHKYHSAMLEIRYFRAPIVELFEFSRRSSELQTELLADSTAELIQRIS